MGFTIGVEAPEHKKQKMLIGKNKIFYLLFIYYRFFVPFHHAIVFAFISRFIALFHVPKVFRTLRFLITL